MNKILEIDGPPMAWIQVGDTRNEFQMITFKGYRPDNLVKAMDSIVERIKSELGDGIIYWRRRPEIRSSDEPREEGLFAISCRVTTSPKLSEEFWSSIGDRNE